MLFISSNCKSKFLFEPTRWDIATTFNVQGPRGSNKALAAQKPMRKLFDISKYFGITLACLTLVGCATASVCPGKTEKEIAAEKRAGTYEGYAKSYRIRNDEEQAKYYDEKARDERWKATGESDWFSAIVLAIFGAECNH